MPAVSLPPPAAGRRPLARRRAGVTLRPRGFTLLETLVGVAVAAVLAAVAAPDFGDALRKARRHDAVVALALVQQAQEQWRGQHGAYAASLTAAGDAVDAATPPGLGLATAASPLGYYTLSLDRADRHGYTLRATAVAGRAQAADGACRVLAVRVGDGRLQFGAGDPVVDWSDPQRCWAR